MVLKSCEEIADLLGFVGGVVEQVSIDALCDEEENEDIIKIRFLVKVKFKGTKKEIHTHFTFPFYKYKAKEKLSLFNYSSLLDIVANNAYLQTKVLFYLEEIE